ncbi:hypothetical protein [Bacillus sp. THAF10]|uniref:hypothetical protein n=1 Tax=Bacillus sp. THAF10 TaxID=2587848 RepID=UPI00126821E7|nr:hypothetical protein [Bacillus sp. THAF10]
MTDVKVIIENQSFSKREQKILEVLLLNLAAQANAQTIGEGMALNPLEFFSEKGELLHYRFAWQKAITQEKYSEFKEGIQRRFNNTFKMCELPQPEISFKENAYAEQ